MQHDLLIDRRSVLRAGAGVGALGWAGVVSGEDGVCPACAEPHAVDAVRIERALPPAVDGSATVRGLCVRQTWTVHVLIDGADVHQTPVTLDCTDDPETVAFEFEPARPLHPGVHEVAVTVEGHGYSREVRETFSVPSERP